MKNRRENVRRAVLQRHAEQEDDTRRGKEIEFFAASVNAWYNTTLEHDKSIFALSAGSIGLLITLLTTVGVTSATMLYLYGAAIASFLLCLVTILFIFKGNRDHIMDVVVSGITSEDSTLVKLDVASMILFSIGVLIAAIIGMMAAYNSYDSKGNSMANEKQTSQSANGGMAYDSVNGCADFTKSFSGVGKLQPSASTPSTSTAQPANPPAQPAATATPKSGK
jgi:hypothetical protein